MARKKRETMEWRGLGDWTFLTCVGADEGVDCEGETTRAFSEMWKLSLKARLPKQSVLMKMKRAWQRNDWSRTGIGL